MNLADLLTAGKDIAQKAQDLRSATQSFNTGTSATPVQIPVGSTPAPASAGNTQAQSPAPTTNKHAVLIFGGVAIAVLFLIIFGVFLKHK